LIDSDNTMMVENPEILREKLLQQESSLKLEINSVPDIITQAKNSPKTLFIVFGSLYCLGEFM